MAVDKEPVTITVFDVEGRVMPIQQQQEYSSYHVSLLQSAKGIYTMRVVIGNEIFTTKLVVN
jgi:hypothetical protein